MNYARQKEERMEQLRQEQYQNELQECKFHPQISRKTQMMMTREQELQRDKFSNLYDDARRRKDRQDQIYSACVDAECTF